MLTPWSFRFFDDHLAKYITIRGLSTPFGSLRILANWLSGVARNSTILNPHSQFAWTRDINYFTWDAKLFPVQAIKELPMASIEHVTELLNAVYEWVEPGWQPTDLAKRIMQGFDINPNTYFYDDPTSTQPFFANPKHPVASSTDSIIPKLAEQNRLIRHVNGTPIVNLTTVNQFFELVTPLIHVCRSIYCCCLSF